LPPSEGAGNNASDGRRAIADRLDEKQEGLPKAFEYVLRRHPEGTGMHSLGLQSVTAGSDTDPPYLLIAVQTPARIVLRAN
jgi:hypothetical protein